MKVKSFLTILVGVLFLLTMVPLTGHAEVPEQINYQGYLTDPDGNPVLDGDYLMGFSIYDLLTGGSELWGESQTVTVTNGVYNVLLGIGKPLSPKIFDGELFLEVDVEGELLTPRLPLTSTAFAMRAGVADSVTDGAVITVMIADDAITGQKIASDQISSVHIDSGAVGSGEIQNNSVSTEDVGFNYAGSNSKGGPATDLSCTGCVSGSELSFAPGDITAVLTGHGLTGGAYSGNVTLSVQPPLSLSQGNWKYATISGTHTSTNYGVYGKNSSSGNYGYLGSEGIGVRGEHNNGNYGYLASTSYGVYGRHKSTGNYGYLGSSAVGVRGYSTSESGRGVYGYATNTDAKGVYGYASYSGEDLIETYGGYFIAKGRRGHGIYARADYSGSGLKYAGYFECDSETGYGVYATVNGDYTNWAVRGEGTGSGSSGGWFSTTAEDKTAVYGNATGTEGTYNTNKGGQFRAAGNHGYGLHAQATGTYGTGIYAKGGSSGYAAIFSGNVKITNRSSGAAIMELGEGLDYAEGFDVSELDKIDPGSVLIIDPDNPGKLALSKMPYDTKVAGIAAGANGLGSGVRLGGEEFDQDVALAGRVYCNVDATKVGVEPGDMLTTSSTPGHAMKSTDYARAHGAILGKAMQKLEKGQKGQILVLVTLQ